MIRGQNQRVAEASLMSSEPPNLSAVVRDISTRGHIRARHHFVIRVTQLLHMRETSVSSRVRTKLSRDARGSYQVLTAWSNHRKSEYLARLPDRGNLSIYTPVPKYRGTAVQL